MSQFPRFSVPRQPLIFCLLISLIAVKFHQIYSAAEIDGCHLCVLETLDINRNWLVNGQLKEDSWKAGPIQKNEDLTKSPTMQRIPRRTCWVQKISRLQGTGGLWTRVPCNCEQLWTRVPCRPAISLFCPTSTPHLQYNPWQGLP